MTQSRYRNNADATVPESLVGVWRRESITLAGGEVDDTTAVYWAQMSQEFIDIRVPASRPAVHHAKHLDELSREDLLALTEQKGFSGHTFVEGNRCTWVRDIDFRPNTGRPDTGIIDVQGDTLVETGYPDSVLGSSYREIYHRQAGGGQRQAALTWGAGQSELHKDAPPARRLIVIDDYFMYARARATPLPPAETLHELVAARFAESPEAVLSLLDCEVSLGRLRDLSPFAQIVISTIPMREGKALFPRCTARPIAQDQLAIVENGSEMTWQIVDGDMTPDELSELVGHS
ncbi:MAG: hypothetical protein WB783_16370 [Arenicellales bacterium]